MTIDCLSFGINTDQSGLCHYDMMMSRTPSYFVWNKRKHVSGSPRQSSMTSKAQDNDAGGGGDSAGPSPHKMCSPRGLSGVDTQSTDTKSSGVSGESDSRPYSAVSISPKHKDPDRIKKDREREERVRQVRERLEGERKKKLVELQEQQRQAQENREKQLEIRRKKIEDLRRRDIERRAAVEGRRRVQEDAERNRRETLLLKAEERVARYEAWKRSGQKGPPPGGIPGAKHLSVSTSVLYHKPKRTSSDFSTTSSRALSPSGCPDSLTALNTIPEGRRSVLASMGPPPSRPKSVMTLSASSAGSTTSSNTVGGVRLRENKSPRKPRPASVATSMPSFMALETPRSSHRSKSTDRLARERSKTRGPRRADDKADEKQEEKKGDKPGVKMSRRTLDRLSTPKQPVTHADGKEAMPPKRESPVARKPSVKEKKEKPHHPPSAATTTPVTALGGTPTPSTSAATAGDTPSSPGLHTPSRTPTRVQSPTPTADEDGGSAAAAAAAKVTPVLAEKSAAEITAEEYKAKLAEKRRQAREKAERDAEEERKRQEELQRQEEERRQQEEEEQRRQEEEALRLAEEARKAEEERLRKAIEAEEQRKAEEAARIEQDRLAKEEAERKAREEAERLEQERLEKARREEEERQERKRRLEMIMKRVKTDSPAESKETASKSLTNSPTKSATSTTTSSDVSPSEPEGKDFATTLPPPAAKPAAEEPEESIDGKAAEAGQIETPASGSGSLSPVGAPSPVPAAAQEEMPAVVAPEAVAAATDAEVPAAPAEPEARPTLAASEVEHTESAPSNIPPASQSPATKPFEASAENGSDRPKFKSPLLQKLVEGKDDAGGSGGPRFKSPLLQNILGKTKVGARMGLGQDHSVSTPDLSHSARNGQGSGEPGMMAMPDVMSASMVDVSSGDSSHKEAQNVNEEKDVDTSEESSSHSSPSHTVTLSPNAVTNGDSVELVSAHENSVSGVEPSQGDSKVTSEPMEISSFDLFAAHPIMATSAMSFWSEQDSGASFGSDDLRPAAPASPLQLSLNGHGPTTDVGKLPLQGFQGMEDSSISMRSVESSVISSSITDSATGSVFSSVSSLPQGQGQSGGDKEFEELIDLSINNKASTTSTTTTTILDNSADIVNFNKFEDESAETTGVPSPIIAFEDSNTLRQQDVSDLLS